MSSSSGNAPRAASIPGPIIGMYVHQHWPYNHPYAARTWTIEDWRGYLDGLSKIGYNAILFWPMLETMPNPLTPSDEASLARHAAMIDIAHKEFGMRVLLALCPNVVAVDEVARRDSYENRHFFYCDRRIDPADKQAVAGMIAWREKIMKPLAAVDGVAIIDSDPGGYPNSTIPEFINLLGEHRKMFDRQRPGIELIYWMHVGWPAYGRFYATAELEMGAHEEFVETLAQLKALNPEPWGLANGLSHAEAIGEAGRVISFNYGKIEAEPSYPFTRYTPRETYSGSGAGTPRGTLGNAQTHCVQLPNTFAFVRGALGRPIADDDMRQFADDLIPGHGAAILAAWQAIQSCEPTACASALEQLAPLKGQTLAGGRLKGLLFGDLHRFIADLVFQLRVAKSKTEFIVATRGKNDVPEKLAAFIEAAEAWQLRTGYKDYWYWPELFEALATLGHPQVDWIVSNTNWFLYDQKGGFTGFDKIKHGAYMTETHAPRLLEAMKMALYEMKTGEQLPPRRPQRFSQATPASTDFPE